MFWSTTFQPHPQLAPFEIIKITYACPQPSGLVRLESMQGLQGYSISCVAPTTRCDRVTHGTHIPSPFPQIRPCCIKSSCKCGLCPRSGRIGASFRMCCFLPKWCKTVPEKLVACSPCPQLSFFTDPFIMFATFVHFMHGWGWQYSEHGDKKANGPCLGGSNGGDDPMHCP